MEFVQIKDKHHLEVYIDHIMKLQEYVDKTMGDASWYIPSPREEFEEYIRNGGIILLAIDDGRIVAVSSAACDKAHLKDVRARGVKVKGLNPFYYSVVFVDPAYRGQKLQLSLMQKTLMLAKAKGYRNVWCRVHPDNKYSIINIEKCGLKKIDAYITAEGWIRHAYFRKL